MLIQATNIRSGRVPPNFGYPMQPRNGLTGLFAQEAKEQAYSPNQEIFGEGEPADYLYKVTNGVVRSYKLFGDGRRKIEAFRFRGDIFGFECKSRHEFCAEAVNDVAVAMVRRNSVARPDIHADADSELWALTTQDLQRLQRHVLLLAKNGRERIANFLLEMSERLGNPDVVHLPMSRQDVADYLGLTIETVSRTMTQFQAEGLIALVSSRQIVLCDLGALQRMNG